MKTKIYSLICAICVILTLSLALSSCNLRDSSGGLYDKNGHLIGIVNAKIVDDGVENIGYAIPSNVAVSIANNIIDYCYGKDNKNVQRALVGVTVTSKNSRAVYNSETGLISIVETISVYEVSSGSLADGKLCAGDILVSASFGDKTVEITRQYHMIDMMLDVRPGDIVEVTVLRDGETVTVSMEIDENCLVAY